MLHDHERVDPIARYVAREEVPREECRGGGGSSRVRGGRRRWGVRIPQTMSRFLIPVLLYLRRLRPRGRPKQLKFDFCPYTERLILRRGSADGIRTTYPCKNDDQGGRREKIHESFWGCARVTREGDTRGKAKKEIQTGRTKEGKYVRRRECLGRPFQSGDNGARSVYTFWNFADSDFLGNTRNGNIKRSKKVRRKEKKSQRQLGPLFKFCNI